ncbi:MAG: hypothetical protein MJ252_17500 [archaeon]|nr:hypothetical protein [archaeon]
MYSPDSSAIEDIISICEKDLAESTKIKNGIDYSVDCTSEKTKAAASFLFNLNLDLNKIISVLDKLKLNKNSVQYKLENASLRIEELEAKLKEKESDVFNLERVIRDQELKISNLDKINQKNMSYIEELLAKQKISQNNQNGEYVNIGNISQLSTKNNLCSTYEINSFSNDRSFLNLRSYPESSTNRENSLNRTTGGFYQRGRLNYDYPDNLDGYKSDDNNRSIDGINSRRSHHKNYSIDLHSNPLMDKYTKNLNYKYGKYAGAEENNIRTYDPASLLVANSRPIESKDYINRRNPNTEKENEVNKYLSKTLTPTEEKNLRIPENNERPFIKSERQTIDKENYPIRNNSNYDLKPSYENIDIPMSNKNEFGNPIESPLTNQYLNMNQNIPGNEEGNKMIKEKPIGDNSVYQMQSQRADNDGKEQAISMDKINRIQNIVMAAFQDEETIGVLKQRLGNDFEDKLIKGDVTEEYLDQIEEILNEIKANKIENKKNIPEVDNDNLPKGKYTYENDNMDYLKKISKSGSDKKLKSKKPKIAYNSLAQKNQLKRELEDKRYHYREYPHGWRSSKDYFVNNGTSTGKYEKSPLKI